MVLFTPWSLRRLHRSGRLRLSHLTLGGSFVDAASLVSAAVPRQFCPADAESLAHGLGSSSPGLDIATVAQT